MIAIKIYIRNVLAVTVVISVTLVLLLSDYRPLLYTKFDICQHWRDEHNTLPGQLTWWQRACKLEADWETMDLDCRDTRFMGNWPVCFDEPYSPIRKDRACVVYSFGIANDFRFDDALADINCTVYSFDPSMGVEDHKRNARVHFFNLGIGAEDNANFAPRIDGYTDSSSRWNVKKLRSIMKTLGHSNNSLSIIKLDVESNEWTVLANLLAEGLLQSIPQVLVEWHIFSDVDESELLPMHTEYQRFQGLGFKKFWMRNEGRNHWLPKFHTQAETAYVNTRYRNNGR